MRRLTEREKLLVELVHLLAYGDKLEFGLSLDEVYALLEKPIPRYNNRNCLEVLSPKLIQEIRDHLEDCKR